MAKLNLTIPDNKKQKYQDVTPLGQSQSSNQELEPFTPLNKQVIVEKFQEKLTSKTGIYISSGEPSRKERPAQGVIRYIADDIEGLEVGDIVIFGQYAQRTITLDKVYSVLSVVDVLGTVTEPPEL